VGPSSCPTVMRSWSGANCEVAIRRSTVGVSLAECSSNTEWLPLQSTFVSIRTGWRREWGSKPRYRFPYTRFPNVGPKPIGHPSENCCNAGNITLHARVRNPLRARGRVRPRERKRSIHAAHVARVAHVIAGEFAGAFAERRGADEFEQRLQGRQEI